MVSVLIQHALRIVSVDQMLMEQASKEFAVVMIFALVALALLRLMALFPLIVLRVTIVK